MIEQFTESITLQEMKAKLGENLFGFVYPQGDVYNIDKAQICLKRAGGKPKVCSIEDYSLGGNGKGKPEYFITLNCDPNTVIIVECKKSSKYHASEQRNHPKDYAVDGVLYYAKYLKDEYNVIAIAISGTSKDKLKVNTFYWPKNVLIYSELKKATDIILEPENYYRLIKGERLQKEYSLQEIRNTAVLLHEELRTIKMTERNKPIFISGILIALNNDDFCNDWHNYTKFNSVVTNLISTINIQLDNSDISKDKIDNIKNAFNIIKNNEKLKAIPLGQVGSITWYIEQLELKIKPMMDYTETTLDALGVFYHEFVKYSNSDGNNLGMVLTPQHLCEFMCELVNVNKNSKVLDICCGSGSFLVSAMGKMFKSANPTEIEFIKKNSLYGVEIDPELFTLAITNMIVRHDGKSNIYNKDCFDNKLKKELKEKNINIGLLNPPYSQKDVCELEFVEQLLDILIVGGKAAVVVPMSSAIGTKFKEVRERLLKKHTLKAVFSMPDDIFYPTATNVCVMVWEAHTPHNSSIETFFGYCKDDGFVKRKKLGRVDAYGKWEKIKNEWLRLYRNKIIETDKSASHCITENDEWLCEAYMKIDYKKITENYFVDTLRKYLSFKVSLGLTDCNSKFVPKSSDPLDTTKWQEFNVSDLFSPYLAKAYHKNYLIPLDNFSEQEKIEYVTRTGLNNGVDCYVLKEDFKTEGPNTITVGAEGVTFFYHENSFICGNKVSILKNHCLNKYNAMFLISVLNYKLKDIYNYGRAIVLNKLQKMIIELPALSTDKTKPDWEFMENYIKSLPYGDRI